LAGSPIEHGEGFFGPGEEGYARGFAGGERDQEVLGVWVARGDIGFELGADCGVLGQQGRSTRPSSSVGACHRHAQDGRQRTVLGSGRLARSAATTQGVLVTMPIPTVRLEDLAEPTFSPEMTELRAGAASFATMLPLEVDAILAQAIAELGGVLTDFGSDIFREPLGVLVEALKNEAGLGGFGHVSAQTQLVGMAKNRLLMTDIVNRNPEILEIPIVRPIIIVGQPRTGTTHLHNLLAADPHLRSLPYWESQQPVPLPGEMGIEPDPRIARCDAGLQIGEAMMPHFKRMHEMTVEHVHEEIQLLANSFSTMYFETMALMPSWRDWYLTHDQTPFYEELKVQLQVMTFLRGGERWVLKSPQHLEQIQALNNVFPDATMLITHRDPVSVTISLLTMLAYTARMARDRVDLHELGAYWSDRNAVMSDAVVRDRDLVPPERSMDVIFHEFMADDLATVERIYELADQPYGPDSRAAHADYVAHHERDRHGKVAYEFEQFGVDPEALRERLQPYVDRFGVRIEWPT
jgi:Sulfotransferase family